MVMTSAPSLKLRARSLPSLEMTKISLGDVGEVLDRDGIGLRVGHQLADGGGGGPPLDWAKEWVSTALPRNKPATRVTVSQDAIFMRISFCSPTAVCAHIRETRQAQIWPR
jgi:hypothetical protein